MSRSFAHRWLDEVLPATSLTDLLGKLSAGIAAELGSREITVCAIDGKRWLAVSQLPQGTSQAWSATTSDEFWEELNKLSHGPAKPHFTPWYWHSVLVGGVVHPVSTRESFPDWWPALQELAPRWIRQLHWHHAACASSEPTISLSETISKSEKRMNSREGEAPAEPEFPSDPSLCGSVGASPSRLENSLSPIAPSRFILPDRDRLEALAEFAAGAGHEINNPLATIIGRSQQLLKEETHPQRRQALLTIGAQAYRVRDMIGDVMLFARPPIPERRQTNLVSLIQSQLQQMERLLKDQNCHVITELPAELTLNIDPAQIGVVLSELLRNSMQALQPSGGEISLTLERTDRTVRLIIADHGHGFDDLTREHAFNPFFSGRQAGRGLGFGLCKAWRIVTQHGGEMAIESAPNRPTRVIVMLPIEP